MRCPALGQYAGSIISTGCRGGLRVCQDQAVTGNPRVVAVIDLARDGREPHASACFRAGCDGLKTHPTGLGHTGEFRAGNVALTASPKLFRTVISSTCITNVPRAPNTCQGVDDPGFRRGVPRCKRTLARDRQSAFRQKSEKTAPTYERLELPSFE